MSDAVMRIGRWTTHSKPQDIVIDMLADRNRVVGWEIGEGGGGKLEEGEVQY